MNEENPIADIEKANVEASIASHQREDDEDHEPEPSEEDLALRGLDKEHIEDYLAIKHAVARTNLADRLVALAVHLGFADRT